MVYLIEIKGFISLNSQINLAAIFHNSIGKMTCPAKFCIVMFSGFLVFDVMAKYSQLKGGDQDAVMGELDGQTYPCWTILAKYSCVIAYASGKAAGEDIFRMTESIKQVK